MWTWGVWMDADLVGHGVPDPLVELLALHHEGPVAGPDDPALGGDRARRVDVVARHHADRDTGFLTLSNCIRHFRPNRVLNANLKVK